MTEVVGRPIDRHVVAGGRGCPDLGDPLGRRGFLQNDEVPALSCQGVSGTLLWLSRCPYEHRFYPLHHAETGTASAAETRMNDHVERCFPSVAKRLRTWTLSPLLR